MNKTILFPEAVKKALDKKGYTFNYYAGNNHEGQVWFDKRLNKIMYVIETCKIVGSMPLKQAKLYGSEKYLTRYNL